MSLRGTCEQVSPSAVLLLGVLIPAMEPLGWGSPTKGKLTSVQARLVCHTLCGLGRRAGGCEQIWLGRACPRSQ